MDDKDVESHKSAQIALRHSFLFSFMGNSINNCVCVFLPSPTKFQLHRAYIKSTITDTDELMFMVSVGMLLLDFHQAAYKTIGLSMFESILELGVSVAFLYAEKSEIQKNRRIS